MSAGKIIAMPLFAASYIYHLMAVARVVFDNDYSRKYESSISPSSRGIIKENGALISFGRGSSGPLIDFVVALPIMLDLQSTGAYREYYELLIAGVTSGDGQDMIRRYHLSPDETAPWYGTEPDDFVYAKPHLQALELFARVMIDELESFEQMVWPNEQNAIQRVCDKVNRELYGQNIIEHWENVTGLEFQRDSFRAVLCSAIGDGPNANSFAYDGVVFYSDTPYEKLIHLIIHEVGTHILVEPFRRVLDKGEIAHQYLFMTYECLARSRAARVIQTDSPAYSLPAYHENLLMPWLDEHGADCKGADLDRLLEDGARFLEAKLEK